MSSKQTMFPVRPARGIGESLPGYAYRLHDTNGHSIPPALRFAFSALYSIGNHERRQRAAETIGRVVGELTDKDWPLQPKRHGWLRQTYSWVRICPRCIQDTGYHRALWELPLVQACPTHECAMVTHCICGNALSWRTIKSEWRCRCGRPLSELHAPAAGRGLVSLARLIAACSATGNIDGKQITTGVSNKFRGLSLQDTYQQVAYAHDMAILLSGAGKAGRESDQTPGEAAGQLLMDWPRGLQGRLSQWLRFQCGGHHASVIIFHSASPIARFWRYLAQDEHAGAMPSLAHDKAKSYLLRFILPLAFHDIAVIHPDVPDEGREAALVRINCWLSEFSAMVDHMDEPRPDQGVSTDANRWKTASRHRRSLRFILGHLLNASMRGDDPTRFRKIAQVWPPIALPPGLNGFAGFAHLIEPLQGASAAHLMYLEELCANVAEEDDCKLRWRPSRPAMGGREGGNLV